MAQDTSHDKRRRLNFIGCLFGQIDRHRAAGWGLMILIYLAWLALKHWGH